MLVWELRKGYDKGYGKGYGWEPRGYGGWKGGW